MADGYVLLEINTEGEARVKDDEVKWFDFRLHGVPFEDCEGTDQLVADLPDLKDCLVMVIFDYKCNCTRDYWGDYDYEEIFTAVSHYIVKEGYKEFSRELITEELNVGINGELILKAMPDEDNYYKNLVADWEEFYDEDFVPFKKQPKQVNGVIDLWDIIQRGGS